jgi:hypothetical protein
MYNIKFELDGEYYPITLEADYSVETLKLIAACLIGKKVELIDLYYQEKILKANINEISKIGLAQNEIIKIKLKSIPTGEDSELDFQAIYKDFTPLKNHKKKFN